MTVFYDVEDTIRRFCEPCMARRTFDRIGCLVCGCPLGTTREVTEEGRLLITFPDGRNFTCDDVEGCE